MCPSRLLKKDEKYSEKEDPEANGLNKPVNCQATHGVSWASAVGRHETKALENKNVTFTVYSEPPPPN